MPEFGKFIESPFTAIIVAIVLGGLALSGRFSVTATQLLFVAAWGIALVGLREQPLPVILGGGICLGGALFLLGYWARPELVPGNSGLLQSREDTSLIFSPTKAGTIAKIQIGTSGVFLVGANNEIGKLLFPALTESQFKVESVNGRIKISTKITDQSGDLIAEIIRNEWKVSPGKAWDRNYSDNALEVKDSRGLVVLQVRVLTDRIQIQGAWWWDMPPPNGLRRFWIWADPTKSGAQIEIRPKNDPNPVNIPAIFVYPGDQHLGELAK